MFNKHALWLSTVHYGSNETSWRFPVSGLRWDASSGKLNPAWRVQKCPASRVVALKLDWKIICSQNIWLRFDFLTRGTDVCVSNWWGVRVSWVVFLNFWQDENFICSFFSACWQLPLRWTGGLPLPVGFQGGAPLFGVVVPEGALAGLGRTPVGRSA